MCSQNDIFGNRKLILAIFFCSLVILLISSLCISFKGLVCLSSNIGVEFTHLYISTLCQETVMIRHNLGHSTAGTQVHNCICQIQLILLFIFFSYCMHFDFSFFNSVQVLQFFFGACALSIQCVNCGTSCMLY